MRSTCGVHPHIHRIPLRQKRIYPRQRVAEQNKQQIQLLETQTVRRNSKTMTPVKFALRLSDHERRTSR